MLTFSALDRELAQKETRVAYPPPETGLPKGPLFFNEFYCNEPRCDCRRVVILVSDDKGTQLAGLNYAFEPPVDPHEQQLAIDPTNRQSRHSEGLCGLFEFMLADPAYHERLIRHYTLFKAAVDNPRHPQHGAVRGELHDDPGFRPAFPKGERAKAPPADALYVFRLGPIDTEEGSAHLHIGVLGARVLQPASDRTTAAALRALARQVPKGTPLFCAPDLAAAGKKLGFSSVDLPEDVVGTRALLALQLAHGPLAPGATSELLPLISAAAEFWGSKVWDRQRLNVVPILRVRGANEATYEVAVMGSGGQEFGVTLYPKLGSVAAIELALKKNRPDLALGMDLIGVSLDEEPAFAATAVGALSGLGRVPITLAMRGGQAGPVVAAEVLTLAVALHALARIGDDDDELSFSLEFGDDKLDVTLTVPRPKTRKKRGATSR